MAGRSATARAGCTTSAAVRRSRTSGWRPVPPGATTCLCQRGCIGSIAGAVSLLVAFAVELGLDLRSDEGGLVLLVRVGELEVLVRLRDAGDCFESRAFSEGVVVKQSLDEDSEGLEHASEPVGVSDARVESEGAQEEVLLVYATKLLLDCSGIVVDLFVAALESPIKRLIDLS